MEKRVTTKEKRGITLLHVHTVQYNAKKVNEVHLGLSDTFSCGYSRKHLIGHEKFIQVN